MRILDLGCGSETTSYRIMDRFPDCQIHGINISVDQLQTASQYNLDNTETPFFPRQDYHQIGFNSDMFDRIIFCESLIHSTLFK